MRRTQTRFWEGAPACRSCEPAIADRANTLQDRFYVPHSKYTCSGPIIRFSKDTSNDIYLCENESFKLIPSLNSNPLMLQGANMAVMSSRSLLLLCATALVGCAVVPASSYAQTNPAPSPKRSSAEKKKPGATKDRTTQPRSGTASASSKARSIAAASDESIVVTATRRAVSVQNSPTNITAIGADTIRNERLDDIKTLAALLPGVTVLNSGPNGAGNIVMRGISTSGTSTNGVYKNNAVGVYLGEVPMYLDFMLLDINHVESLQGPQGTLFGLGTLGGTIRYMPNRPDTHKYSITLHGRVFGQYHSTSPGGDEDVTINLPIWKDHIAFRSVTGYYDDPGYIDYDYVLRQPGVSNPQPAGPGSFGTPAQQAQNFSRHSGVNFNHTLTTRNQLLLRYNDDLKMYLTYAHQETKTDGRSATGVGVMETGNWEAPWRYLEPVDRNGDLFSAEVNANVFNIAQFVSTTAFTHQVIETRNDNTDLLLHLDYGYQAFPQFSSWNESYNDYRQFNQELRLVSTHKGPFSWVLGGFYNKFNTNTLYEEHVPGFSEWGVANGFGNLYRPDELEYASRVETETAERALYSEGTLHLMKDLQITGGIRYFDYDASDSGGSGLPLYQPYPEVKLSHAGGGTGSNGIVWKANASYRFSPQLMSYFTYSTGYRVGGYNRVAACVLPINTSVQNICALPNEISYKPDSTRNIELGFRGNLFHNRFVFSIDGYHVDWLNVQVPSQTVYGAVGITTNGGRAASNGFEFSGSLRITRQFHVTANYSYVDAHLTEGVADLVNGVANAYAGDRLPGSMKNSGAITATYILPLDDDRTLRFNWMAAYSGSIYSTVGLRDYGTRIPSYVTHRASINYRSGKWNMSLFMNNIFNQRAITAVSNQSNTLNEQVTGVTERYYAQSILAPRVVGLEASVNF
ncbi:TonB-dependent receptor [Acidomonas methanolica]|uniref:TonB-dependent receptor n=1 Tax=Acidomonas methanolica TaxID=437 RepID=UPI00211A4B5C|nr:TonB-dependent receptor [Acidomonas methanolica]